MYCMAIYAVDDATPGVHVCGWESESNELIIEDQAFTLSYDLVIWLLPYPLPPLPSVSSTGDTQED